jgi:glycosyltransferase involved in cell wall biosynthesis
MPTALLDTWRKFHPDYEFRIRRDATGFPYPEQWDAMRELNGKSDLARFWDLYDVGGIHLDTDMECVQRIPDSFLSAECFASWENEVSAPPGWIASCVLGSRPRSAFFKRIVEEIPKLDMTKQAVFELGPGVITRLAKLHPELKVHPGRTFCPWHYGGQLAPGDSPVYGIHHWTGTQGVKRDENGRWTDPPEWKQAPEPEPYDGPVPTVSIIIPAYGQAKYLYESIASACAQTFRDTEIIVVCGDAASADVARKFEADGRIRVIEAPPRGLSDARNIGIAAARGRFILSGPDADDIVHPQFIEKTLPHVENEEFAIASCRVQEFGASSNVWNLAPWEGLLEQNCLPAIALYPKKLWELVGGYRPEISYEDWGLWVDAFDAVGDKLKVTQIPEYLYKYRVHDESLFRWDQKNGADRWWRAMIRLLHPSLYAAERLEEDRDTMRSMPGPLLAKLYDRAVKFPGNHALRAFVGMAKAGLPEVPVHPSPAVVNRCECIQCKSEREALAAMRRR